MENGQAEHHAVSTGTLTSPDEMLVEVMNDLAQKIPTNEFGMPAYIYRPDTMPANLQELAPSDRHKRIELSKVPLYYNDGFPTTRKGSLFWDRLDHEGNGDFMLFRQYLEMSQAHGYRSIQVMARAMFEQQAANKQYVTQRKEELEVDRNIFLDVEVSSGGSNTNNFTPRVEDEEAALQGTLGYLRQLYVLYFWHQRAAAFDLVGQAAVRKIRESRAILLEDHHYIKLTGMVEKVMTRFDKFSDADMDSLNPVDTVKILKELVHLQRVSTGLPGAAPSDSHLPGHKDDTGTMSVEDHLRSINKNRAVADKQKSQNLLDDDDTASIAQELFMRILRNQ